MLVTAGRGFGVQSLDEPKPWVGIVSWYDGRDRRPTTAAPGSNPDVSPKGGAHRRHFRRGNSVTR
jgi:hypothetical protein